MPRFKVAMRNVLFALLAALCPVLAAAQHIAVDRTLSPAQILAGPNSRRAPVYLADRKALPAGVAANRATGGRPAMRVSELRLAMHLPLTHR